MAFPLFGFLNNYTSPAYNDDPALCSSVYPDACDDPEIAEALDKFPYWNYRADGGGGNRLFLGTSGGYLWGITCQHCGSSLATWTGMGGALAGRVFDSVGHDGVVGSGAYRQFGNGNDPPLGSGAPGDLIYRFLPQTGTLPDLPLIRILPSLSLLTSDTLILTIGDGVTGGHHSLGWFSECGTTTAGGMPATGRPACCTNERWSGNYGPRGVNPGSLGCNVPRGNNPANSFGSPACWGGEGDFDACTLAGLEYLGPVWASDADSHWGTSRFDPSRLVYSNHPDGTPRIVWTRYPNYASTPGPYDTECIDRTVGNPYVPIGSYVEHNPPTTADKTQMMCVVDGPSGQISSSVTSGDSGSADFAYVDGVWYYISSGAGPGSGYMETLPETSMDDWVDWIIGSNSDIDSDGLLDPFDNCVDVANGPNDLSHQVDTDRDGFGNACDSDIDNTDVTGTTTILDYSPWLYCFQNAGGGVPIVPANSGLPDDPTCEESEHSGDGFMTVLDFGVFLKYLQSGDPPGPSGLSCADPSIDVALGDAPCP